jgi:hypothetical protein
MKSIRYCALLAIVALCNLANISAQDRPNRGNFDPAQFRERMMARVRETMEVKDDAEWKLISDRVSKVMDAQRDARQGGNMGMMFRRPQGDQNGGDGGNGGNRRRGGGGPGGFGGEPSPEAEALHKALESKASNDDVKAALAKYRESRKARQEKLTKAQEDLKKVLSGRQEAAAVSMGLLD